MPTEYSKCHECHYVDVFPITHKINIFYFRDYQKALALTESTMIPIEIAAKIVSMSKEYTSCDYCFRTLLCETHYNKAIGYGNFNMAKCDACCWFDI